VRIIVLIATLALPLAAASAETAIPFVGEVPEAKLRAIGGDARNAMDIWEKPTSNVLPLQGGPSTGARVQNLYISASDGLLVLSQLWGPDCTVSLCPTQIYLIRNDGTRAIRLAPTMLPQVTPQEHARSLSNDSLGGSRFFLNSDGKSITVLSLSGTPTQFPLKWSGE
jgi:hypothetical protein